DRVAEMRKGRAQVARRRDGIVFQRRGIVDERDRPARGVETLLEQFLDRNELGVKSILLAVACDSDEIQIDDAGPLGTERGKLLIEQDSLPVEHFLLRQPRTRGFGAVILGRDPKLGARENRDEDRKEPREQAEREHRGTTAPARANVKST